MNTNTLTLTVAAEEERLEGLLQRRLGNRIRDLRVQFSPDGLILQGRAMTYYLKQVAQQTVMELCERPIHDNQIVVR